MALVQEISNKMSFIDISTENIAKASEETSASTEEVSASTEKLKPLLLNLLKKLKTAVYPLKK